MPSPEGFTNWEIIRTTADYKLMMTNILFGDLDRERIFNDDDKLKDDYQESVTSVESFRAFCSRHGLEKKLDIEKLIHEAEAAYLTLEQTPITNEKNEEGIDNLFREVRGMSEVEIKERRDTRKKKPNKKPLQ